MRRCANERGPANAVSGGQVAMRPFRHRGAWVQEVQDTGAHFAVDLTGFARMSNLRRVIART